MDRPVSIPGARTTFLDAKGVAPKPERRRRTMGSTPGGRIYGESLQPKGGRMKSAVENSHMTPFAACAPIVGKRARKAPEAEITLTV
jgi:hypothetical protein